MIKYRLRLIYIVFKRNMVLWACYFLLNNLILSGVLADPVQLTMIDQWSAIFAGEQSEFLISVNSDQDVAGRLMWQVNSLGRTIYKNEKSVNLGKNRLNRFSINVIPPKLKESVDVKALLRIEFIKRGKNSSVIRLEKTIKIFSKQSFSYKNKKLENLDIVLFDPLGKTEEIFKAGRIPFRILQSLNSPLDFIGGMLVVGEGVSLNNYRGLSGVLLQLAASGVPVLCLALEDGKFPLDKFADIQINMPDKIIFAHQDIIKKLENNLDYIAWLPDGKVVASTIRMDADRFGIVGVIEPGNSGWSWMEIDFSQSGGKFLFTGFAIIEKWESSPVPRYLLKNLLVYLKKPGAKLEPQSNTNVEKLL